MLSSQIDNKMSLRPLSLKITFEYKFDTNVLMKFKRRFTNKSEKSFSVEWWKFIMMIVVDKLFCHKHDTNPIYNNGD